MNRIELTAKKHGLGQQTLNDLQNKKYARLEAEEAKRSTGVYAKDFEPNVRHLLTKHGLTRNDFHCRTNGSNTHYIEDGVIFVNGQRLRYEVKTGDGIIGYIEPSEDPEWNEDDILPGVDLVIYACEVKEMTCEDDILDNTIVLMRNGFLTFIATEGPKNKKTVRTATKFGTNDKFWREQNKKGGHWRDCIVLQPTYRRARQIACLSGEYTSLRTFLEENDRT